MVLLKNDGVLPLKTSGIKIAVVGPLAEQTRVLLGNYTGVPTHTVSILEGLKAEFAGDTIRYVPGTRFLTREAEPVPAALLTTGGKPGVKAVYTQKDPTVEGGPKPAPLITRIEKEIDTASVPLPAQVAGVNPLAIHWETTLTPVESGEYNLGVRGDGFFTLSLNGKRVITTWDTFGEDTELGRVSLEKGKPYQVKLDYSPNGKPVAKARLVLGEARLYARSRGH